MKYMITSAEARQKGVWPELARLFGRDAQDDIWDSEEFILTEEQARSLHLAGPGRS